MSAFKPYKGYTRNLVVAFDVGTTYSGISYAILDPGDVPEIYSVTSYPQQVNGDHKIPTILHYSDDGQVQHVGAEVHKAVTKLRDEGQDPIVAEWFKLHLGPDNMKLNAELESNNSNRSFVSGKTAIDIYTDFLRYLFHCARQFIIETWGERLWNSVEDRTEIILSHPNGWGGLQQSKLRDAAVHAGLVPDITGGRQRVHFVSEGEASLHYCINNGLPPQALQDGKSVMVIDAGGGTVDINTYQFVTSSPVKVDEIAPAMCAVQGSTRVNLQARKFLEAKLKGSKYGSKEDLDEMLEHFETSAKRTFADDSERSYIKFGGRRDTDSKLGIRHGQLVLEGSDMAEFFKPSVDAIVDAVIKQHSASSAPVSLALLVGGYAASPWLFTKLKKCLAGIGLEIFRPNTHTNKAVADGAVSFYLKGIVASRVAQRTYGVPCSRSFCPFFLDHIIRSARVFTRPCGQPAITGAFSAILTRGTRIHEAQELAIPLARQSESPVTEVTIDILCYRGTSDEPRWLDEEPEHFHHLCSIHADVTSAKAQRKFGPEGSFYEQDIKVILLCGLTEMKAQISWEEDGIEKRGPAQVIYDDDPIAFARE